MTGQLATCSTITSTVDPLLHYFYHIFLTNSLVQSSTYIFLKKKNTSYIHSSYHLRLLFFIFWIHILIAIIVHSDRQQGYHAEQRCHCAKRHRSVIVRSTDLRESSICVQRNRSLPEHSLTAELRTESSGCNCVCHRVWLSYIGRWLVDPPLKCLNMI